MLGLDEMIFQGLFQPGLFYDSPFLCRKILYADDWLSNRTGAQTSYKISILQYFQQLADEALRNLILH